MVVNKDGKQVTVKQPLPIPEGVSDYAVGHDVAELTSVKSISNPKLEFELGSIDYGEEEIGMSDEEEEIFVFCEKATEFPGGEEALYEFLRNNIKYPEEAKEKNISGTVVIKFVIEKDGSISHARILREIGGGCGAEALRVVNMMPKWKPGEQGGKPIRCEFTLPVQFKNVVNDK